MIRWLSRLCTHEPKFTMNFYLIGVLLFTVGKLTDSRTQNIFFKQVISYSS